MSRTASTSINGDNPKLSILGYSPDRLDFSHSNLLRREEELQRLSDIYECVQQGAEYSNSRNDKKERVSIAMIRGLSGTGKSFLAKKFLANLEKKSQEPWGPIMPFFLYGKYDDLSGADPFSALIDAFNGFANILLNGGDDELMRVRRDIRSELGSEANYLTTVVPGLRNVTGGDCDNTIGSKENASNRLKYIFQKFTNAISTAKRPVVMLLDDLQWCDLASAELIEALLTDSDLRYFMFIGTYRSDDMEADNSFFGTLQNIEKKRPVQNIKLVNLTLEEMGSFISEVLDIPKINAELLTQIVFDKTLGNIFFAKQVLEELHRNGLLEISPTSLKWEWHLDGVNLDNILSDDVIQVVTAKLQCAPFKLQRALIIAAYTRSTFDLNTLQKLLELDGHAIPSRKLMKILDKAVLDGHLINSMGSDSYSFAHDGIRQAAYNLIPTGEARDSFRFTLGQRLYELGKTNDGEDWMIFTAADHLNDTAHNLDEALFLINLNSEAGEKAAACAAFEAASKYLGYALQDILHLENPWESHYDTTLKVYQSIVDVELCQGHLSVGKAIGEEVLKRAKYQEDKMPVQLALSKALGRKEKHKESFDMSVKTLQLLKEYPRGTLSLYAGLVKDLIFVKRYFKKKSDDDILSLPMMKNKRTESIIAFLSTSSIQAYFCGNMVEFLVGVLRVIRLTIKYGLSGQSGVALTGYCLFCNNINDMTGAIRFSKLARRVLKWTKARHLEALQLFAMANFIYTWGNSCEEVLDTYYDAYKSGMETGDFENGLLSKMGGQHHEFVSGYKLKPLSEKYSNLVLKLQSYKIDAVLGITFEEWFVIQHLIGIGKTAFTEFDDTVSDDDTYRITLGYLARLQLAVYFGDYDFAEIMVEKLVVIAEFDKSHSVCALRLYFSSLAYTTIARLKQKKSYELKARKFYNQLKSMCKTKGLNSWHRCILMEAHLKSVGGKRASFVQSSYDHAIELALKSGHKQDAGLAAQLAAEHFLNIRDDVLNSRVLTKARDLLVRNYLMEARYLFNQWGASALVKHLEQKYASFLGPRDMTSSEVELFDLGGSMRTLDLVTSEGSTSKPSDPKNDEVSVLTDNSTYWKQRNDSKKPHTNLGDLKTLVEKYEEVM